ncbi:hypothetical protein CARUB_v10022471mg [Capsella rubella]|uniref:Bifunctional inhibitor/plant lipid transfer protein/seed storage helical domain-containing protein n=1 Tax=Capsella rubella TaxID=81985 RepID=R0GGA4_9BRAS|nr:hypothetical protein CARUB_v10022471mg [Capsella rubella]
MKQKQTKVVFLFLALIFASIIRASESAPPVIYCSTNKINNVPGCYNALKLLGLKTDIRGLSKECCRAVFTTLPTTCFLKVTGDISIPITIFKDVCDIVPSAVKPSS